MKHSLISLLLLVSAAWFAGCVGDTDPATDVTSKTARLNAHGHTNNGPATWWWEYSTSKTMLEQGNGVQVCGSGTGPKEPDNRCGPAETPNSNDIPLNVVITGLTPDTTYYFRACGKDESAQSGSCLTVHSFKTLKEHYVFERKWGIKGSGNGQFNQPAGVAAGLERVSATAVATRVYVGDFYNGRIEKFNATGGFLAKWGSFGTGDGQFNGAHSVARLVQNGVVTILAGDPYNSRIEKFTSSGAFLTKWGSGGSGPSQFNLPRGLAADSAGNVYVADTENHRVQKFSSSGAFIREWGGFGSGNGQLKYPWGVAADSSGNVYVADSANSRVQKFSSTGAYITKWGAQGSGDGQFLGARAIATDSAGNVYVADTNNARIQKFGPSGAFLAKWGTHGSGNGQFDTPLGLAVDNNGHVYVADTFNHRIQVFGKE